jgi:hypothetical protein
LPDQQIYSGDEPVRLPNGHNFPQGLDENQIGPTVRMDSVLNPLVLDHRVAIRRGVRDSCHRAARR